MTITTKQLAAAEALIKNWIKTSFLRRQALTELREQVALIRTFDKEDLDYLRWVSGNEPPVRVLSNWVRVDGHSVSDLNRALTEALGLNDL